MRIMIVDDEKPALGDLKDEVCAVVPTAEVNCFDCCADCLSAAREQKFDVAFIDITMPDKDGLTLSKELKDLNPNTNIVFVTGYSEYAVNAFAMNASGYILKPARKTDIINALNNLRIPVQYSEKKLRVQCFGNFEVYLDGKRIMFQRALCKELFAYLIDLKGASANTNELCEVLFGATGSGEKHYLRNVIANLKQTFKSCGVEDVLEFNRNSFSVNPTKVDCDYYRFLEYDNAAVNSYSGAYMKQYSWAEMTNGSLFICDPNH